VTEGGWDRPHDRARTLGERDGNDESLAEGDEDDDDEYGEDGDIPDDDDEYAAGVDGVGETETSGEDARQGWSVRGGGVFLISGRRIERRKKLQK
jgi:hypothetical protein